MAKDKIVNYTDEDVKMLQAGYTGTDNKTEVAALARELGKSEGSVRGKLSSMGKYVTEAKAKGTVRVTKAMLVSAIGTQVEDGFTDAEVEGLLKATSVPLAKIVKALVTKREVEAE